MATITELSTAAQDAATNAIVDLLDAGTGAGDLLIYDGTMPAPNDTGAGTLLVTIPLDATAFGAASSGTATMADLDPVNWGADGTADYWRLVDGDGDPIIQGNVTVTAGDGSLKLSSITAVTGSPVDVTAFTYTTPSGE
jgi:hypothetical protein